ncbi:hypothetical protein MKY34_20110 [Sporosarcina sp. FSL K6-1522]
MIIDVVGTVGVKMIFDATAGSVIAGVLIGVGEYLSDCHLNSNRL